MKKSLIAVATILSVCALPVLADALAVAPDATIEKILEAQKGKRVTVKLGASEELTGVVEAVTPQVVHLGELSGKEFFDAAVATKAITAVIVRTK